MTKYNVTAVYRDGSKSFDGCNRFGALSFMVGILISYLWNGAEFRIYVDNVEAIEEERLNPLGKRLGAP